MELYIYNAKDKTIIARVERVLSYTDSEIVTEDGVYSPLSEGIELSATADCSGTLRADWRRNNPTAESRMEALEEQLVQADETAIALYEAQEEQETINAQQDEALMEIYEMIG